MKSQNHSTTSKARIPTNKVGLFLGRGAVCFRLWFPRPTSLSDSEPRRPGLRACFRQAVMEQPALRLLPEPTARPALGCHGTRLPCTLRVGRRNNRRTQQGVTAQGQAGMRSVSGGLLWGDPRATGTAEDSPAGHYPIHGIQKLQWKPHPPSLHPQIHYRP